MKIEEIQWKSRNDFGAIIVCEHCGHHQGINTGYDDYNYHQNVIPKMTCAACKRNRSGTIPDTPNEVGNGPNERAIKLEYRTIQVWMEKKE